jgi:tripartite-type tricarboxylate transporter receptor subunit TctC
MTNIMVVVALVVSLALFGGPVQAQQAQWPAKPVRIVVPSTPGGTPDQIARLFGARLSNELGQQFLVDNRPGASGMIGAEIVARANPDGYTLAVVPSSFAINAALYKVSYDPVTGIEPIGMIVNGPLLLTVNVSVQAKNLDEFIALIRSKPGSFRYGSTGAGTNIHLAGALFEQMTGAQMLHVPYKGQGPAIIDLLGGQIQVVFASMPVTAAHVSSGKLRALAVTTANRSPVLPDLPAISEVLPGYNADFWTAMWAPKGTPRVIVQRLNQEIVAFLNQPEFKKLQAAGMQPAHSTPERLAQIIERERAMWTRVVKKAGIKVDQ